jgi:hypothetical protein
MASSDSPSLFSGNHCRFDDQTNCLMCPIVTPGRPCMHGGDPNSNTPSPWPCSAPRASKRRILLFFYSVRNSGVVCASRTINSPVCTVNADPDDPSHIAERIGSDRSSERHAPVSVPIGQKTDISMGGDLRKVSPCRLSNAPLNQGGVSPWRREHKPTMTITTDKRRRLPAYGARDVSAGIRSTARHVFSTDSTFVRSDHHLKPWPPSLLPP